MSANLLSVNFFGSSDIRNRIGEGYLMGGEEE